MPEAPPGPPRRVKTSLIIAGSVFPCGRTPSMALEIPTTLRNARLRARTPAPPVVTRVPTRSKSSSFTLPILREDQVQVRAQKYFRVADIHFNFESAVCFRADKAE